ncbi:hypothetical protein EYF80_061325 [Liparis tanakae]|uniref:Uncharacterized protein n=1 Tax=Liparis tanakae TaxID=230148 RepID=A0A4Z2EHV1_9TELE|nr:hypothetical protein EYF80_061325 [Liparis tanakae]
MSAWTTFRCLRLSSWTSQCSAPSPSDGISGAVQKHPEPGRNCNSQAAPGRSSSSSSSSPASATGRARDAARTPSTTDALRRGAP